MVPLRGGFRDDDPDRGGLAPEESAFIARGGSPEKEKANQRRRGRAGQVGEPCREEMAGDQTCHGVRR